MVEFVTVRDLYVQVDRRTAVDEGLSYEALGVLVGMLGMGSSAPKSVGDLRGRGLGRDRLTRCLEELETAGYRFRFSAYDGELLEEIVVLSDRPLSSVQARARLPYRLRDRVVACLSHEVEEA